MKFSGAMTIQEIAERVSHGEIIKIPSTYFGLFYQEASRLTESHCWQIEALGPYFSIARQAAPPAPEEPK